MKTDKKIATISARCSQEQKDKMVMYCEKHDITLTQLIVNAVEEYINKGVRINDRD